ncbi:MAG: hypothetical protein RBR24_10070, partial [Candidatus Carbobacillus sp.]|nr:hypothetical protein [Candidatus Carbobacillus sp.]
KTVQAKSDKPGQPSEPGNGDSNGDHQTPPSNDSGATAPGKKKDKPGEKKPPGETLPGLPIPPIEDPPTDGAPISP